MFESKFFDRCMWELSLTFYTVSFIGIICISLQVKSSDIVI